MKINIIVALYFPHFYEKVRKEIFSIFRNMNFLLLFVDNSRKLIPHFEKNNNVIWIKGSNVGHEFSAWDEGYSFLRKNSLSKEDIVVFINDTFCHHRYFTFYDKILYRKAILHCINSEKNIYGEVNNIKKIFFIKDTPMLSWISSYFFFGSNLDIESIIPFDFISSRNSCFIRRIKKDIYNRSINIPYFSKNLNQHLQNWLFPKKRNGWYNAQISSYDILFEKIKSIFNEKMLSFRILQKGLCIHDIYESKINRIYNLTRNKIYYLLKN